MVLLINSISQTTAAKYGQRSSTDVSTALFQFHIRVLDAPSWHICDRI